MRSSNHRSLCTKGFTILEVCVVLFIIAVMFSIGVPTASHLLDEEKLQAPIRELQTFARTARRHALMENRAYEVLLLDDSYLLRPVDNNNDAGRKAITYGLPSGVTFAIERLGEHEFLKQTDSAWYFSPNGLCEPMKFLFQRQGDWVRFHVDPLTGTIQKEESYTQ